MAITEFKFTLASKFDRFISPRLWKKVPTDKPKLNHVQTQRSHRRCLAHTVFMVFKLEKWPCSEWKKNGITISCGDSKRTTRKLSDYVKKRIRSFKPLIKTLLEHEHIRWLLSIEFINILCLSLLIQFSPCPAKFVSQFYLELRKLQSSNLVFIWRNSDCIIE